MARRMVREPTVAEMTDACNAVMENGISEAEMCRRLERAAAIVGIRNLYVKNREDAAWRNKVANARGNVSELRKLAAQNLTKRRK